MAIRRKMRPVNRKREIKGQRQLIADALKLAALSYLTEKGLSCALELAVQAWGARRADVVASSMKGHITILEIKSCAADFKIDNDKSKWHNYLPYCNQLFFVVPEKLLDSKIGPSMIEAIKVQGCGVMILDERTGKLRVKIRARLRKMEGRFKKHMLCRLAWRGGHNKSNFTARRVYLNRLGDQ